MSKKLLWYLFIGIFLFIGCEKRPTDDSVLPQDDEDELISQAKFFFENRLLPDQQAARLGNDKQKWFKNKQPQWKEAISFKKDGKEIVEVPLLINGIDPAYFIGSQSDYQTAIKNSREGVTKALFLSKPMEF